MSEESEKIIRELIVTRGSDVEVKRVYWVLPDWVPQGALTLLAGREGLGKSTIAARICADITRGIIRDSILNKPRFVLYIHSEDSREHTVAPRLKVAGANMDYVLFLDVRTEYTEHGALILPRDMQAVEKVIRDYDVAFIVLDAATSAMSSELSGKDDRQVRQFLEPLAQMAARNDLAILGIVHFGKKNDTDSGKLILGSIAWSQVARSVLSVALDKDGSLLVTNTKGNLAPRVRTMEARIVSQALDTDDGVTEVGVLEWLGETSKDARDFLASENGDDDQDDRTEAEAWLEDYLTVHGPSVSAQVKKDAKRDGISERTLKRAKQSLGVVDTSTGFPRKTVWSLADSGATEIIEGVYTSEGGPTGPTGDDLRKQSGPTEDKMQSGHSPVYGPTGEPTVKKGDTWLISGEPVLERARCFIHPAETIGSTGKCIACVLEQAAAKREAGAA